MKSMEEYINDVYKKYEEAEKNHIVYKKVKMKRSNPLPVLCGIVACLLVVIMVYSSLNSVKPDPNNEQKFVSNEEKSGERIVYTDEILFAENLLSNYLKFLASDSEVIAIASNCEYKGVTFDYIQNRFVLKTNYDAYVLKVLKGKSFDVEKSMNFTKIGGTISISELQKDSSIDWKEWEKIYINKEIPEEEKEISYFKQYVPGACEFEDGKQYLVFMKYNNEKDTYEFTNIKYGVMEYDPATNMVKNIDTGEFEEFDWSLITEE